MAGHLPISDCCHRFSDAVDHVGRNHGRTRIRGDSDRTSCTTMHEDPGTPLIQAVGVLACREPSRSIAGHSHRQSSALLGGEAGSSEPLPNIWKASRETTENEKAPKIGSLLYIHSRHRFCRPAWLCARIVRRSAGCLTWRRWAGAWLRVPGRSGRRVRAPRRCGPCASRS